MESLNKRQFLAASISAAVGLSSVRKTLAQQGIAAPAALANGTPGNNRPVVTRKAKTTKLFKAPDGFPNGIAVTPEGLWIAEQKENGAAAAQYHLSEPKDLAEHAWLVDWNG